MGHEPVRRWDNLDLLKAIAIFFVIIYHVGGPYQGGEWLKLDGDNPAAIANFGVIGVFSLCVPIFFMINGALLLNKPLNLKKHIIKIVVLIILTFIWSFITQIIFVAVGYWPEKITLIDLVKNTYSLPQSLNNHLWFMGALVIIYIFFPLIKSSWDYNRSWFLFFLFFSMICVFGNSLMNCGIDILQFIKNGTIGDGVANHDFLGIFNPLRGINGHAFVYFMLGGILFEQKETLNTSQYRQIALVVFIVSILLYWSFNMLIAVSGHAEYDIVWHGYEAPSTLLATAALFVATLNIHAEQFIRVPLHFIGGNTLGIYFVHWILIGVVRASGIHIQSVLGRSILPYIVYAAIILVVSCIICWIISKVPGVRKLIRL
ncbi:acyltransferase [Bifidobacterium eulemuris]|uniref:Acyltransferase n=1 Tax=Bifidobacterium eulemuris TaxID=1765219 RepID=A0A261G2J3_9BIFI|nr:acyltransferase [Bifidobacterium eulemuris]OZG65657.1 Acyltransferase family [Bifidobacterium eulemuris]QOL32422.1 acyltransferase [Bifidobacterium eulemuris]